MSTSYAPLGKIRFSDLFDGRLQLFNVREHVHEHTSASSRCLTDENNYLWVYRAEDGSVSSFTRNGLTNVPTKILKAICEAFDVEIVSEYEPQYWGFETTEEWDAAWAKMAGETMDQFYDDLRDHVVRVTLSSKALAVMKMYSTHEDDLPKG